MILSVLRLLGNIEHFRSGFYPTTICSECHVSRVCLEWERWWWSEPRVVQFSQHLVYGHGKPRKTSSRRPPEGLYYQSLRQIYSFISRWGPYDRTACCGKERKEDMNEYVTIKDNHLTCWPHVSLNWPDDLSPQSADKWKWSQQSVLRPRPSPSYRA